MFQTEAVEKIRTQILCSITSFWNRCKINVEKYFRAGKGTYDSMAHAHCMLDA